MLCGLEIVLNSPKIAVAHENLALAVGIVADSGMKVMRRVGGPTDVQTLKCAGRALHGADRSVSDFPIDQRVVAVPLSRPVVRHCSIGLPVTFLEGLNGLGVNIYDDDVARYAVSIAPVISGRAISSSVDMRQEQVLSCVYKYGSTFCI